VTPCICAIRCSREVFFVTSPRPPPPSLIQVSLCLPHILHHQHGYQSYRRSRSIYLPLLLIFAALTATLLQSLGMMKLQRTRERISKLSVFLGSTGVARFCFRLMTLFLLFQGSFCNFRVCRRMRTASARYWPSPTFSCCAIALRFQNQRRAFPPNIYCSSSHISSSRVTGAPISSANAYISRLTSRQLDMGKSSEPPRLSIEGVIRQCVCTRAALLHMH
jgi:hypothetical protein